MPRPRKSSPAPPPKADVVSPPRIIGGTLRGRTLLYGGDRRTRPMKDRVRESVFALLGPRIVGRFAVDLFAGTGALGFEALSRGAARALFLERHFPTAHVIRDNARALEMADRAEVFPGDAFVWVKHRMPPAEAPWVVFCSPPYDFFVERRDEMIEMVRTLARHARPETLLVLESDERFDFAALSELTWDLRTYAPAQIGIAVVP